MQPSYKKILQDKIDYYGNTEAAHEFAADQYAMNLFKYLINLKSERLDYLIHNTGFETIKDLDAARDQKRCLSVVKSLFEFEP